MLCGSCLDQDGVACVNIYEINKANKNLKEGFCVQLPGSNCHDRLPATEACVKALSTEALCEGGSTSRLFDLRLTSALYEVLCPELVSKYTA